MMPLSEHMIPVRGPTQLKGPLISPSLKQKPTSINKFTKDFRDILAHKGEASPFSCSLTPEGILGEIVVGVCRPDLQILTLLQTKKCHVSHPFSDLDLFSDLFSTSYYCSDPGLQLRDPAPPNRLSL